MRGDDEMVRRMWSEGRQLLYELGLDYKMAGGMIGKWNRLYGASRTMAAINHLDEKRPAPKDLIRFATQFFKEEYRQALPGGSI